MFFFSHLIIFRFKEKLSSKRVPLYFKFSVLCPLGWLNYQIYCYYPVTAAATWANGRLYCQKFGADLLVIKSQAEYDFIVPYAAAIIGSYGLGNIGYYTNVTISRKLNTGVVNFLIFFI